jgi:Acyltransferase
LPRLDSSFGSTHCNRLAFFKVTAAPNFAFEQCLNKIDDASLQELDLSSLRMVANGAEPINVPTMRRFIERFGRYGFRPTAMAPVYGLAENSVAVSLPPPGRGPIIDRVDRESLSGQGVAAPAGRDGRHIYPEEIEEAVGEISGIRPAGVAVFGATDRASGTERVVILAETRESDPAARAALRVRAQQVADDIAGVPPDDVVLAPLQTVPRTSSGKIRRSAAKEIYESGRIGMPQRAFWRQILRLWLAGIRPQVVRLVTVGREMLYAGWWWLVVGVAALLAWIAVMVLPRIDQRWRTVRRIARIGLAAMGVPVTVAGLDRLPRGNAVLVFNHLSYADALVLAAVLPGEPTFTAKREFATQRFAGPFLRRWEPCSSSAMTSAAASPIPAAPLRRLGTATTSCSFLKGHSRFGPGSPNSISALSKWLPKPAFPLCLEFFVEHGRCCVPINGFPLDPAQRRNYRCNRAIRCRFCVDAPAA